MAETRKLLAILASDVVGFSRLTGADEDRTLARLRTLRSDVIDPTIAVHNGRVVKRTGDGSIVEFRSVVDAVRCAIEVQNAMIERNAGVPEDRRIVFRIGIHIGDVVEENDGDLMGDGVNIATRLEGIANPGAICLSEDAYRQVKGRLDLAVSDLGNQSLKNIAEPMRAYSLQVGVPAQAKPKEPQVQRRKRSIRLPLLVALTALLAVLGATAWYAFIADRSAPAGKGHLSIVVLPFTNLSGDASQDYFADGITENLTTDISQIRNSFVIARNTAFTFKGKAIDAKEIGKELSVRYVLEGSVQRDGNRVRVNAQLIDADSGAHLWADRFEEEVADLFKLQDEVVARLANALGYELVKAEAERSARSGNPDAIDLTMRGWAILNQQQLLPDNEILASALALFEQALRADPNNVDALVGAAGAERFMVINGGANGRPELVADIDGRLANALRIDPLNARAYTVRGMVDVVTRRNNEAKEAARKAVALNPNYASAYAQLAQDQVAPSEFALALDNADRAIKLSPRDPQLGRWRWIKGKTLVYMGRYMEALEEEQAALDSGYQSWPAYAFLAVANALLGRQSEAETALAQARKLNPKLSIKWMRARLDEPEITYDGLRKAGLPEE
jgi:adenylate cyclase